MKIYELKIRTFLLEDIDSSDSLGFISLEGLRQACGNKTYYENCFNGYNPLERI